VYTEEFQKLKHSFARFLLRKLSITCEASGFWFCRHAWFSLRRAICRLRKCGHFRRFAAFAALFAVGLSTPRH